MLRGYRVLDFTDERGLLCGSILADLGADVIHIEPPGGSGARRQGPFAGDEPDPDNSLFWWAYARNQRSIALDPARSDDQATLRRLLSTADFLIESFSPGEMSRHGLGYEKLREDHPSLVYVSISPYGQRGPKAQLAASDLTIGAESGFLFMTGDEDRPPVRVSCGEQAHLFAGAEAAVGALVASQDRSRTGFGQHVDVSAQQALNAATQSDALSHRVGDRYTTRSAGGMYYGGVKLRNLYPAKDGYVSIAFLFGSTLGPGTDRLMQVIFEEGLCDRATREKDWIAYGDLLARGVEPPEEFERVKTLVETFTRSKTKEELLSLAVERRLLMAPVSTVSDLVTSPQLSARDYFQTLSHPDRGPVGHYPGPFARFSASPIRYERPAPRIDEHRNEIIASLPDETPRSAAGPGIQQGATRPLGGLKVLDLMWAVSGPTATRVLADFGATVVRIESTTRVDASRTLRPFRGGEAGGDASALFHTLNAGKSMMTLDLTNEAGRAVFLDLVRWADVVCESFSPGVMRKLGLDYDVLREVNPDVILLSTNLMGKTGPLGTFAGYGNMASAWCGFHEVTGWADREPAGPWGAYTDHVAARYNTIALLAAVEHHARTGEGQHIDLAQAEASLHFLAPAFLDFETNQRIPSRAGNEDPRFVPHGVYPTREDERWIALAIDGDDPWKTLCKVLSLPDDLAGQTQDQRRSEASALDERIAHCTLEWNANQLALRLQEAGIAAAAVQTGADVANDPQLAERGHFIELPHPDGGKTTVEGSRFLLSRSPAVTNPEFPQLGRDNDEILREILGYEDERVIEIVLAGALD